MTKRMLTVLLCLLLLAALLCACGGEKTDDNQGEAALPTMAPPEGYGNPVVDPDDFAPESGQAAAPEGSENGGESPSRGGDAQSGTEPWPSLEPAPSLPSSLTPTPNLPTPSQPTPSQPAPSQPAPSQSPSQPAPRGDTDEDVPSSSARPSYPDTDEDLNP